MALSRARAAIIIIGDCETVQADSGWLDTLTYIKLNNHFHNLLVFTCPVHHEQRSLSARNVTEALTACVFGNSETNEPTPCPCTRFTTKLFNPDAA